MILFLDFDGVLHHMNRREGALCHLPRVEKILRDFPDLEIVVSSAWRTEYSIKILRTFFSDDIRNMIIDVTPCFDDRQPMKFIREAEIKEWLRLNGRHPQRWIALDDSDWLFRPNCANLILVDPDVGFIESTGNELLKRLAP
jgi:hypothetical protein